MVSQISKYSSFPDLRRKINSVIKDRSKCCATVLFDYTNWTCSLFSNWTDLSHLFHSLPLFVSNDFVTVSPSFYFLFVSLALICLQCCPFCPNCCHFAPSSPSLTMRQIFDFSKLRASNQNLGHFFATLRLRRVVQYK